MRKRQENWLKVSMLTIYVGATVLRQLLSDIVQASFLNDSEYLWLETVQKIQNTNCAASLLLRFTKDIRDKDETCRGILKPLIMSWRSTKDQMLTWSEQVSSLEQMDQDIAQCVYSSQSNVKDMLSSWRKQIRETIIALKSMSTYLKSWTNDLRQLCQQHQQDLQRKTKEYYDDFLSSSRETLNKRKSRNKTKLQKDITKLQNDREKMQKTWKAESEKYLKSVGQNIRDLLTSWSQSTIIPEWKKLLEDFETEASEMNDTKLQMSCDTWHKKLHDLFYQLSNNIDKKKEIWKKLKRFPSIESQQVKDFLSSIGQNKKLQKQLSTLYHSSGIPDINKCDITLLTIILKDFLVYPPLKGWNDKPPEYDNSVGADILRLRSFRRDIIVHTNKFQIDEGKFETLWCDIKKVLCRLADRSGHEYKKKVDDEVDQLKSLSSDDFCLPQVYHILKICKKDTLAELNGQLEHRKYKELKKSIRRVKRAKSRIKKDYGSVDSNSDSERSESSSGSESADSSSDSERSESSSGSESADSSSDSGTS